MKQTHLSRVFGDIHLPQFLIACYMLALLLETVLVSTFRPIKYLDEATALLMGIIFLADCIYARRVHRDELLIIALTACMIALGLAGNLKYDLLHTKYYWALDAFNMFKFIVTSLGAVRLFSRTKHNEYIIQYLALFSEIVIIVSTICLIINCFTDINMSTDVRYGFRTYNFVFKRVGDFYQAGLYMLMFLFADLFIERRKSTWVFIALTMLNMASTFRSRAFIYAFLFILFFLIFVILKIEKIKIRYAVPIVVAAAGTFAGQFVYYFTGNAARSVLLRHGIKVMLACFPIGSGFGTYGTAVAQQHYSKLYLRYGFWQYFGTSMKNRSFLLDNYWPAVMAELGLFGALCMLSVILLLFRRNASMCKNPFAKIAVYSGWIALFASSAVSSSFLSATKAMVFYALVGIFAPMAEDEPVPFTSLASSKSVKKRERFYSKLTGLQRFLLSAAILFVFICCVLTFHMRGRIQAKFFPETIRKHTEIKVSDEVMIFNGGYFEPFTEDMVLKNARLKDVSFRDKSVDFIRELIGERYDALTDEEIEAVTGERVVNGLTKAEYLQQADPGEEPDLSAFDGVMNSEERDRVLSSSSELEKPFDVSGPALKDILNILIATQETGNFRDRYIYYYYRTYSKFQIESMRKLRLEGYHLPSIRMTGPIPYVTRDMLTFDASSDRALKRQYDALADYFGIVTNDGYGSDTSATMEVECTWDFFKSQHVSVRFISDTAYGVPAAKTAIVRVAGPEITLSDCAVTLRKGDVFDPYSYVESVLDEDGRDVSRLLKVENTVNTERPGFYTVTYSCGEDSLISMAVKVKK